MRNTDLEELLSQEILDTERLSGGSGAEVYLVTTKSGEKFIYKKGASEDIEVQRIFYDFYQKSPLLPKLISSSPNSDQFILSYLDQEKVADFGKQKILEDLITNFINIYKPIKRDSFGFLSARIQAPTFSDFLKAQSLSTWKEDTQLLPESDLQFTYNLINKVYTDKVFSEQYLIHGDLGFHNFYYNKTKITGIIDPDPIVGHPLYDLCYAFLTISQQFSLTSFQRLLAKLSKTYPVNRNHYKEYLLIALFKRIYSSRKHHPHDLPAYLEIWTRLITKSL